MHTNAINTKSGPNKQHKSHSKKNYAKRGQTEPGLVAFYIRPGNGAGLFYQLRAHKAPWCRIPHGA